MRSDLAAGAGLSSSAALEVAVALALGADATDPVAVARLCQAAEHAARGVPTGLLDQLASLCGVAGCALRLDCRSLEVTAVALPPPDEAQWLVVWTGARSLASSGYSTRVTELAAAEATIGPLRDADLADLDAIGDDVVRARARHVVSENGRVDDFAGGAGRRGPGHGGRRDDGEPRQPARRFRLLDVADRRAVPDVVGNVWRPRGAHHGGGWGGCVVALTDPGAVDVGSFEAAWYVRPSAGATVSEQPA